MQSLGQQDWVQWDTVCMWYFNSIESSQHTSIAQQRFNPQPVNSCPQKVSLFCFSHAAPFEINGPCNEKWAKRVKPQAEMWINLGATEITSKLFWAVNPGVKSYLSTQPQWTNHALTNCISNLLCVVLCAVCCVTTKLVLKKKSRKHYRRRITSSFRQRCLENLMLLAGFPEHLPPANGSSITG